MNNKQKNDTSIRYNKVSKMNKSFMYQDLKRSNCYGVDFSKCNFNFTSLRGAHFKSCNFYGVSFKNAEAIGTNFKNSKFKYAILENMIFEGANLDEADFTDAKFKNVVFVGCNIEKSKGINTTSNQIRIFDKMPEIEISERLENAIKHAMNNKFVKMSRTLDTKDGSINTISIMLLLENYKENRLIDGLILLGDKVDKEFSTLSYINKSLETYTKQGLM